MAGHGTWPVTGSCPLCGSGPAAEPVPPVPFITAFFAPLSRADTLKRGRGLRQTEPVETNKEFFESVMVPQIMLYGFLGFRPTADGFAVNPRLPKDWPELTITRIHLQAAVLNIAARDKTVTVTGTGAEDEPIVAALSDGWQLSGTSADLVVAQ